MTQCQYAQGIKMHAAWQKSAAAQSPLEILTALAKSAGGLPRGFPWRATDFFPGNDPMARIADIHGQIQGKNNRAR